MNIGKTSRKILRDWLNAPNKRKYDQIALRQLLEALSEPQEQETTEQVSEQTARDVEMTCRNCIKSNDNNCNRLIISNIKNGGYEQLTNCSAWKTAVYIKQETPDTVPNKEQPIDPLEQAREYFNDMAENDPIYNSNGPVEIGYVELKNLYESAVAYWENDYKRLHIEYIRLLDRVDKPEQVSEQTARDMHEEFIIDECEDSYIKRLRKKGYIKQETPDTVPNKEQATITAECKADSTEPVKHTMTTEQPIDPLEQARELRYNYDYFPDEHTQMEVAEYYNEICQLYESALACRDKQIVELKQETPDTDKE